MSESVLKLTDAAKAKIQQLLARPESRTEGQKGLRIYIVGGGCAGFQYGFKLDSGLDPEKDIGISIPAEGDSDFMVFVDRQSLGELEGSEVDYQQDFHGSKFVVKNPKAKRTCGCGASFCL